VPDTFDRQGAMERVRQQLRSPMADRMWYLADGLRLGMPDKELFALTKIDPWFLEQLRGLVMFEQRLVRQASRRPMSLDEALLWEAKEFGFSDDRIAQLTGWAVAAIRAQRTSSSARTVTYKRVDTCAAEFEAHTPYLYSTYGSECEARPTNRKKVIILGGGPNRIGQGIEFDYCCVHAAMALRDEGIETMMVNCNPETVSTDYDTSDRLYFEPLTEEDVLNIIERERPLGVVLQFGGQTPLKLAIPLSKAGVPILGTSPEAIDRAEDRERFRELLNILGLKQAESGVARSVNEAVAIAAKIGYPVMVRPSYVLGGRAMQIVYDATGLLSYMESAAQASDKHPLLIDKYLSDAIEVDADAICDGRRVVVAGIMEHIEEAGVHSGDSACSLPPYSLDQSVVEEIRRQMTALALELGVVGLMNAQFAVKDHNVYVLEVNPRGSRTVPFVSKAIGVPLAKLAMKTMVGRTLDELGFIDAPHPVHLSVKEAVFPFNKFPGVDVLLGPEMKSTGEVMGIDTDFGWSFAKSQAGAGAILPRGGTAFISVKESDRPAALEVARHLHRLGFSVWGTSGTAGYLREHGVDAKSVLKVTEGRPHIVDHIKNGEVALVVNTVGTAASHADSLSIRREALNRGLAYYTTMRGARAAAMGIEAILKKELTIRSLQEHHAGR
ncbi:MAG TPA: carbamoyl-phosphate synthase large subunit, partial [Nitrospiraceae bacterium]|nr:carbamoyl-phosphate synthase large subunit [Nitrospiraceae bacterium]